MSDYKVQVGSEFEVTSVEVVTDSDHNLNDAHFIEIKHRNKLSELVLGFVAIYLIAASILGMYEGNFEKLQAFYNVAAIPVTAILSFYFKQKPPA